MDRKITAERETLSLMIGIYCRKKHHTIDSLCEQCQLLQDYAFQKLENCPWKDEKPSCRDCAIHCYAPRQRERIRAIMRFSGPRVLLYHPWKFIRHYLFK